MKIKNGARFEPATHRLQATEQLNKLSNFVQIKNIIKTSFSLFISKGSMPNNRGVPFLLYYTLLINNSWYVYNDYLQVDIACDSHRYLLHTYETVNFKSFFDFVMNGTI